MEQEGRQCLLVPGDVTNEHMLREFIRCEYQLSAVETVERDLHGGTKIFLNNIKSQTSKTLGPMRDAVAIVRGVRSVHCRRRQRPRAIGLPQIQMSGI